MSEPVSSAQLPKPKSTFLQHRPASTALWAHLLGKNTPPVSSNTSDVSHPPIAPLDKAGTSMRILLHDTQSNFEKFSARVDELCATVAEAKGEILTVKTLFQGEHETLTREMVELVNRCQSEIQKSLHHPAQAEELEKIHRDLDSRLQGLNLRIDAIQMLNQTHSQTLQTQAQMLQTLQEQQGKITAALMPLLPLLQAVPLHIESARNHINETILKLPLTSLNDTSSHLSVKHNLTDRSKRSSSTIHSDEVSSSPLSKRKRPRLDTGLTGVPEHAIQPLESKEDKQRLASLYLDAPPTQAHSPASQLLNRRSTFQSLQHQRSRLTPLSTTPSLSSNHRAASIALLNPKTPRRPLEDLVVPTQNQKPVTNAAPMDARRPLNVAVPSLDFGNANELRRNRTTFSFGITPSARPRPQMPPVHSSILNSNAVSVSTIDSIPGNAHTTNNHRPVGSPASSLQGQTFNQAQKVKHVPPHFSAAPVVDEASIAPSYTTSRTSGLGTGIPPTSRHSISRCSSKQPLDAKLPAQHQHPSMTVSQSLLPPTNRTIINAQPKQVHLGGLPTKVMNFRDRRSPFREGRRFIPLDDDDDDDDDDDGNGYEGNG